jgi:hypothetical protein
VEERMLGNYRAYCDESSHLEHDGLRAMGLGVLWCPKEKAREANHGILELKRVHGIAQTAELKWIKVSPAKLDFYQALIDYFLSTTYLNLRVLIVPDKSVLNHAAWHQTHDDWYYKMYYVALKHVLQRCLSCDVFLDYKDTHGGPKVRKLRKYLAAVVSSSIGVQTVRSNEVPLVQLVDLLLGAVTAANRGDVASAAKVALIEQLRRGLHSDLRTESIYSATKFNMFLWPSC